MNTRVFSLFALAMLAIGLLSGAAIAADHSIFTGGEKGAYYGTFCPPIPKALSQAYFTGYKCAVTKGTIDNINNVLATPKNIGMVQGDVFAKWAAENKDPAAKLQIIRSGIAYEGLWMVTKNPGLNNFGDVLGLARRIPFVMPVEGSGSAASFAFLQSLDPDGLGRAHNISYVDDATKVIDAVANGDGGEVGFFVQFADPTNPNIKKIVDSKLKVIPVVSRDLLRAKVGDTPVYQVSEFSLTPDGWVTNGVTVKTASTPVTLITGTPTGFTDQNDIDDQKDMIKTVEALPTDKLLPQNDLTAKLVKKFHALSGDALKVTLDGVDAAKKLAEKQLN